MAQHAAPGRHRAAGRHNPLTEVAGIIARAGDTGVKASAVLAASGGLVAAFALPATAAPATASPTKTTTKVATERVVKAAPALVAPGIQAPERASAFGITGVKAVAKPKPAPVVVTPAASPTDWQADRSQQRASRGTTRSTQGATQAQQAAPARVPAATGGVIGIAMSLLGIYYVYGGSTPAGFDCSGFTSYVFRQVGISLPRTAAAQQAAATPVSNPQPGDLVFFGYPAYHVGIYAGNGMMIDSPRTGAATSVRAIWDSRATFGRP